MHHGGNAAARGVLPRQGGRTYRARAEAARTSRPAGPPGPRARTVGRARGLSRAGSAGPSYRGRGSARIERFPRARGPNPARPRMTPMILPAARRSAITAQPAGPSTSVNAGIAAVRHGGLDDPPVRHAAKEGRGCPASPPDRDDPASTKQGGASWRCRHPPGRSAREPDQNRSGRGSAVVGGIGARSPPLRTRFRSPSDAQLSRMRSTRRAYAT